MSEFNLLDEPWIPVRFLDGRRMELGVSDTFGRANEIAEIEDSSPLVVASLHRVLLAIMYRALEGPTDSDQATSLFRTGLPLDTVLQYLERWRHRFSLFDVANPFGQNINAHDAGQEPWTKLTAEYNGTSNKVLFDHTDAREPVGCEPAGCARWLVATMNFSVSGGRGYFLSPEPNAIMCIPIGGSLHDTLILNLVPYPNCAIAAGDSAQWERMPDTLPPPAPKRAANGYADLYTWPARSVLLQRERDGTVRFMCFAAGSGCERSLTSNDPMQAYRDVKDKGRLPVRMRAGNAAWRDFASLLPDPSGEGSRTVDHAQGFAGFGSRGRVRGLLVIGQKNDPPNATVDFWRMERFVLPGQLSGTRQLRLELESHLAAADHAASALWQCCRNVATHTIGRGAREPAKEDIKQFMLQMVAESVYWSCLEPLFHRMLQAYVDDRDADQIRLLWVTGICSALKDAWAQQSRAAIGADAWTIRAYALADRPFRLEMAKLTREIAQIPTTEVAA